MTSFMRYAILTGDIVASSDLTADQLDRAIRALEQSALSVGDWAGGIEVGFARRGGDGWQVALTLPRMALRAALFLQATLRRMDGAVETRIAMAEGAGTLPGGARPDPNAGHGPAFTDSGRLLDSLPRNTRMAHAAGGALGAAVRLADAISRDWTRAQARALCEALPPDAGTRAEAAARLGISREAVNQALWAAHFPAIEDALSLIEADHD